MAHQRMNYFPTQITYHLYQEQKLIRSPKEASNKLKPQECHYVE